MCLQIGLENWAIGSAEAALYSSALTCTARGHSQTLRMAGSATPNPLSGQASPSATCGRRRSYPRIEVAVDYETMREAKPAESVDTRCVVRWCHNHPADVSSGKQWPLTRMTTRVGCALCASAPSCREWLPGKNVLTSSRQATPAKRRSLAWCRSAGRTKGPVQHDLWMISHEDQAWHYQGQHCL